MILLVSLCVAGSVFFATLAATGTPVSFRLPGKARRGRNADWMAQAQVSPWTFRGVSAGSAAGVLLLCWAVSGSILPGVPLAALGWYVPRAWWQHRARRQSEAVITAWPDAIRHVLASIESRHSVNHAIEQLALHGPVPMRVAFARYPVLARTVGLRGALGIIREQLANPTSDEVIETLMVAADQGTDLALVILRDQIAEIAENLEAERETRSIQYEPLLVARIALVVPWLILLYLVATVGPAKEMYSSRAGVLPIIVAGLVGLGGLALVQRMVRSVAEPRVLGEK